MSNIDFLTADVIQFLSNAKITFSQGDATDLQKKYLTPGLNVLIRMFKKFHTNCYDNLSALVSLELNLQNMSRRIE